MIKTYLKIAWRNITRNKAHSIINITGLSIGIAACLLLFIVITYETGYDKFRTNFDRVYRVVTESGKEGTRDRNPGVPFPLITAAQQDLPELSPTPVITSNGSQFTIEDPAGNKKFIEDNGVYFSEPTVFTIFDTKLLSGNAGALSEPNKIFLSRKTAEKYFGDWKQASGKFLKMDNLSLLSVAGVFEDVPEHTDLPMNVVTSFETLKAHPDNYGYNEDWGGVSSNTQLFILAKPGLPVSTMNAQIGKLHTKYDKRASNRSTRLHYAKPLATMHYDTDFGSLGTHVTSRATLWTLTLIGIFILVMACINFVNLSTAQAVKRSKEVGIRKVMGSNRMNLFWQMMGETAIVVLVSLVMGLLLASAFLPYLEEVSAITEKLNVLNLQTTLLSLGIAIMVVLFAGIYPSLILSGFSPILALKNKISSATVGGISIRRTLVVAQFAISQILIIGTIIAVSQMSFVKKADLGFNKESLLVINGSDDSTSRSRQVAMKQELLSMNGVQSVSFSSDVPSSENNWATNFAFDHKDDAPFPLFLKFADDDYIKTYGLQLIAGRGYEPSDTVKEFVVNETLTKKLGLKNPADAVGKDLRLGGGRWMQIVGVVKDFKTNSLREETKPIMIAPSKRWYGRTGIKMKTANTAALQADLLKVWDKYNPEYASRYAFLDESIANFYSQENQMALIYKIFAGIAIFISCLGLYGLISFMAVQRTKEVGIRKVLGASAGNIVYLFSKEFTVLIVVAFVVAAPIAWFVMKDWLSNFAYQIKPGVGIFLLAIVTSVIVAWLTVGYKAVKAALANPVKSLRTE
ncbi:ABC transporter permease [Pollutibacter soli]|uniref:ABC transporter permease n=1 Tax=Pollutibacter soli TaxID=3034157 RepID=UPI0030137320